MGLWQSALAGLTIFGAHSCDGVLSNNVVHIGSATEQHHIKLMSFKPEQLDKRKIEARILPEKDYSKGIQSFYVSQAVDLGMEGVPVLDQGSEGTCVTFSTTAALDALLGKGDFVSQQCSLALDQSLGQDYWDGADRPAQVIDPLKKYGVVQKYSCPSIYPDRYQYITQQQYTQLADVDASLALNAMQYAYYGQPSVDVVKSALKSGKRVLMAFLLDSAYQQAIQGFNVVMDGYSRMGGLYACKQKSSPNYCVQSRAGHEVLIIGYDDKQELLKIRNSWGTSFGDSGDYYMTYTFFKQMAVDITVVY